MANPWLEVDPVREDGFRKEPTVETRDAAGVERLAGYDHLLMQWHWVDADGAIEYPPNYPEWRPTHWRMANLPDYWPCAG